MAASTPLVSVNMVTYNQAPFLRESIRSVLGQTFTDLELVIVDDGSTDGTPQVVAEFTDPRVVYIRQDNQGPGAATNRGLATCRGRYVALMTGDDLCYPDRIARELEALRRAGGGVVFSNADYIDEDGQPITSAHYPKDFFAIPPMTRGQILERFFASGNFIHTVTAFAELRAFREAGPYEPLLYQLQDLEVLIRLVKRHAFVFLPECTIRWRIRAGGGNLSAFSPGKALRSFTEFYFILSRFFDDVSPDLFREAFGDRLVCPDSHTAVELACEQAFLFLRSSSICLAPLLGLEKLYELFHDETAARLLAERFGLTPHRFVDLLQQIDPGGAFRRYQTVLCVDTGNGWNGSQQLVQLANSDSEQFRLAFDLSAFPGVQRVGWHPQVLRAGRVRLTSVTWTDQAGQVQAADLDRLETNGQREGAGDFTFLTLSPFICIPVHGDVRTLVLEGNWELPATETSAEHLAAAVRAREDQLAALRQQLQDQAAEAEQLHRVRERDVRRVAALEDELGRSHALLQAALASRRRGLTGTLRAAFRYLWGQRAS
ncbi:MAG: glycosyltransferase [Gemmataceae bacterium]|nr:glycosyltransferase [Gemmataceae bacterium]